MSKFTIVIHGGAGTILREHMTGDLEAAYTEGLKTAVDAGFAVLEQGGAAINAVKAAMFFSMRGADRSLPKKVCRRWMLRS
jgi:beta-aspartyl-peptidase (threonine type)